jgi:hypothetical protein
MVGILCLILGYPYRLRLLGIDVGVVDTVLIGRALVYASLILSFASAAEYLALFARAVEKKEARDDAADGEASGAAPPASEELGGPSS